jgi:ATP/maltotriose-dependent transcriptional regulator MalT
MTSVRRGLAGWRNVTTENRGRHEIERLEIARSRADAPDGLKRPAATLPTLRLADEGDLSERELTVLELIADGLSNEQIGRRMCLSTETIKTHVRKMLAKLGARTRAHAVTLGFRRGLLAPNRAA